MKKRMRNEGIYTSYPADYSKSTLSSLEPWAQTSLASLSCPRTGRALPRHASNERTGPLPPPPPKMQKELGEKTFLFRKRGKEERKTSLLLRINLSNKKYLETATRLSIGLRLNCRPNSFPTRGVEERKRK